MFTTRRSIRRYKDIPVEKDKLNAVLEAARWAPSWGNSQCCELVVIQDREKKEALTQILSKKNPATLAMIKAPVVLAVVGGLKKAGYYNGEAKTKFGDWLLYDLGIVTQNICLSAHEQGLGTVIIGSFDHDKARELIGVPKTHEVVAMLPLGYADHEPPAPKRKPMEDFVHYDTF